ncbi:DUF4381 domain-containing protein [Marinomonas pollencensis]|uniref:Uncharacterized protein DUF4381 n=1 Tax=Marinomonas pollencensis TaxID=491954 RepID=A0A3E0DUD6_9GAMM|nr:DUF4381 domain-containing protein [Marinomonas pollencensis]REG86485.1 uncharacterized protein DUF4381 [Marinomonas pollencensis]
MATATTSIALPHKAYLLPNAVPMWPPVWWTWLILAIALLLITGALFLLYKKHRRNAYRREALAALKSNAEKLADSGLIVLCHELIRRCLVSENKLSQAALPAAQLIDTLDQKSPAKYHFKQLGEVFVDGPYRGDITLTPEQRERIINNTRYWIRKHHA